MSTSHVADSRDSSPAPAGSVLRRRFRGVDPESRTAQRRQQLLDAGLEAFGTRGFHAVGVREICSLAKLTERYFYESFKNREALFTAVHESAAKKIEAAMLAAFTKAPADGHELTRRGLRAVLHCFKEDPRVARVVLIEVLGASTGESAFAVSQTFAELIQGIALSLYPNLTDTGVEPSILANGLYGSTVYIAMRWTLNGFKEPVEQIVEHCALFYDNLEQELGKRESVPPVAAKKKPKARTRAT